MAEIRNTTAPASAAPEEDDHGAQDEAYVRDAQDAEKAAATADPEEGLFLHVRDQKFATREEVPTHLGMKIADAASNEDIVAICGRWAPMIIVEADRGRFDDYMIDAEPAIKDEEYMKMFTDLMELVGGRPTKR